MNQLSRELLEYILPNPGVWKKDELDWPTIIQWMEDRRWSRFYYEVYWPRITRLTQRLFDWHWFPKLKFEIGSGDIAGTFYWPADHKIAQFVSDRIDEEMDILYNNEYWGYEEPTREEMLALGIRPNLVRPKVHKDGSIQPSMF